MRSRYTIRTARPRRARRRKRRRCCARLPRKALPLSRARTASVSPSTRGRRRRGEAELPSAKSATATSSRRSGRNIGPKRSYWQRTQSRPRPESRGSPRSSAPRSRTWPKASTKSERATRRPAKGTSRSSEPSRRRTRNTSSRRSRTSSRRSPALSRKFREDRTRFMDIERAEMGGHRAHPPPGSRPSPRRDREAVSGRGRGARRPLTKPHFCRGTRKRSKRARAKWREPGFRFRRASRRR